MVRYDDYKDSGIDWIGEIPSGWELCRIKSLVSNIDEAIPDNPPITIPLERVMPWTGEIAINDSIDDGDGCSKGFKGGDILFSKLRPYLAKAVLAPCDGACSGEMLVLRADNIDRSYLHKIVLSPGFIDTINAMTYGTKMPRASWDLFKDIVVPLPSRLEQEKIASWLNKTTGEISATVRNIEASICLLHEYRQSIITEAVTHGLKPNEPMKPSGVEWIELIPESWQVNSIRGVTSLITNGYVGPTRDLFHNSGVRYIQSLHIVDGKLNFDKHPYYVSEKWSESHARSVLKEGDVLVVQTGAIGNCAYVAKEYEGCNCHALIVLRPEVKEMTGKYLYYYLTGHVGREKMLITRTGTTHPHLNSTKVQFVQVLIPPICEQNEIVAYLDAKTAEIDALIASKERQVELLREYRKSIISEAVTGKFKVPGLE